MQPVQISGEGSALSFLPHSELHFHSPFLSWRMWHISISLFLLIRICWLNINEINPSWWHWICLWFEYACLCSAHWLHAVNPTPLSAQMLVCFLSGLPQVGDFLHQGWEISPKLSFSLKFTFFVVGFFLSLGGTSAIDVCLLLVGVWNAVPPPPYPSCWQWILIEAWLSDNL